MPSTPPEQAPRLPLSYWEAQHLQRRYHLLVVGAGLVGLSAALYFKRKAPQAQVAVFDQSSLPTNASTRNAGFACFGSPTELLADAQVMSEDDLVARIRMRWEGLALLKAELGSKAIGYEPCGGAELFTAKATYEATLAKLPTINAWLQEATGQKQLYTPTTQHGYSLLQNAQEGALNSGLLMLSLLQKARAAGVELHLGVPVNTIEPHTAILQDGLAIHADRILLATSAFTPQLLPSSGIRPARNYVFVTSPLKQLPWRGTYHVDRGYVYFRHLGQDRLLLGGARNLDAAAEQTAEHGINELIKDWLVQFADTTLGLRSWQIDYEWTGIIGQGAQVLPGVQPLDEHFGPGHWLADGLGGIGVATGMQVGHLAAAMMDA